MKVNNVVGKEEKCPKCKGNRLKYGDMDGDGDSIAYAFDCLDCGAHGHEVFTLTYAFHEVDEEIQ